MTDKKKDLKMFGVHYSFQGKRINPRNVVKRVGGGYCVSFDEDEIDETRLGPGSWYGRPVMDSMWFEFYNSIMKKL